jgi:hypothetical protein
MKSQTLPPITKTQKLILLLLYKFRFLTISQLQTYFNHKDPHRVKEWLKNLRDKKYIATIIDSKDITKPYIYCLDTKSRHVLKKENYNKNFLNRIYKEKDLTSVFINHCLSIMDTYLFFRLRQNKDSKLNFCTQQDITGFDYLPKELDAFIEVSNNNKETDRYFLELFDEYRKSTGEARYSVRKYITYSEEGSWQANTDNCQFPSILFIFPDERRKKHINHYGKAKLAKTFEDISLFLTTQDTIRFNKSTQNIWQKVE